MCQVKSLETDLKINNWFEADICITCAGVAIVIVTLRHSGKYIYTEASVFQNEDIILDTKDLYIYPS